jgi:hypothetical protein
MSESEASVLTTTFKEPGKDDREVTAIFSIVAALKPLKEDEVRNVLEYVLRRFGAGPLPVYAATQNRADLGQACCALGRVGRTSSMEFDTQAHP